MSDLYEKASEIIKQLDPKKPEKFSELKEKLDIVWNKMKEKVENDKKYN